MGLIINISRDEDRQPMIRIEEINKLDYERKFDASI